MARELKHVDISQSPDLLRIAEEVHTSNEPRILERENQQLAIVQPLKRRKKARNAIGRPTTADDPLWKLVGIGESTGLGDVSTNKHKYLTDVYTQLHE